MRIITTLYVETIIHTKDILCAVIRSNGVLTKLLIEVCSVQRDSKTTILTKFLKFRALLPQMLKACGNSSVVEHNLAKVGVASSSLVSRSNFSVSWINPQSSGWVAEWSCTGLQIRVPRFDSGLSLHKFDSIPLYSSDFLQKSLFRLVFFCLTITNPIQTKLVGTIGL